MAGLALAFAAGIALFHAGAPLPPAPLLAPLLLLPVWPFLRPGAPASRTDWTRHGALLAALAAGVVLAGAHDARSRADCRLRIAEGPLGGVAGRFVGRPAGGGAPFRLEAAERSECRAVVRAYLPRAGPDVGAGVGLRAAGSWRRAPRPDPLRPERAGYLLLEEARVDSDVPLDPTARLLRARGTLQERIVRLYGERAGVVEALVLARKEALEQELRDSFARAGVAHLLAISGFHVGVVAGLLLALGRLAGLGPGRRPLLAAAGVWLYVAGIGFPDAALRAATILTLLGLGRVRRRPVQPLGALSTAFLALLLIDPGALLRVGFQLSFAGSAGLALWTGGIQGAVRRSWRRIPPGLASAVAAGTAATLATLPLVAWHFGRVSLVGIPATLLAGPVVGVAIPGIAATLALEPVAPGAAAFLAGGVDLLLAALVRSVEWTAALPVASAWTPRSRVVLGVAGAAGVLLWLRARGSPGGRARRTVLAAAVLSGLLLAPVVVAVEGRGTVEIVAIDVGQGDALALRSPAGRWVLVDAGPRSPSFDAGARRVVPYLRRRGVDRLEALILTHGDLDHIGGASAVLERVEVGGVLDPGLALGRRPYQETLTAARDRGVGWWAAASRRMLELDGMELRVLYPWSDDVPDGEPAPDPNDFSVVVLLRFGRFGALLTGDAPAAVEEAVLRRIDGPVQLLKVGHHGSSTSTSRTVVESLRPEVAVVPVGWRNRYGHPHPDVLRRLDGAGVRIYRTDLDGTVSIRARSDGSWTVSAGGR